MKYVLQKHKMAAILVVYKRAARRSELPRSHAAPRETFGKVDRSLDFSAQRTVRFAQVNAGLFSSICQMM